MSIQSEILRIKNNVDAAYDAVEALGGTLPQDQTVANLLAAIASIKGISTIQPSIYQGDISKQIARIAADIASAYRLCEDSGATMPASLVVGNLAACISTIPTDWSWGSEDGEATEAWFAGLAEYLSYNPPSRDWVGMEKSVTLTSEVLGTTTHKIRCIGVNQDGVGTVTFQTSNSLANTTTFGDSAVWIDSTARTQCINYYNAFPGKTYIKTVSKGTCPSTNDSRNGTPTYNNETVWLLSEREIGLDGYAPISIANSTTSKAECTQGYNAPYSYYNSNDRRKKARGDSGSAYFYWGRSRSCGSNVSDYVCVVNADGTAGSNHDGNGLGLAPAFVIGPSTTFNWGSENGEATEAWFAGLAEYLSYNQPSGDWIGKEKRVTLSSEVLGTTTHKIRCIGVNQDGDRTVTFQTSNCLANTTKFSSSDSSPEWIGSTARSQCINYYNAFPGKAYIKTVSKGTCLNTDDNRNGTPTYNNETVWLPSEREMGLDRYAPISTANSTTSKAECTQGYNAAYSYYNRSYSNRVKNQGDSGSAVSYWERSRHYSSSYQNNVCTVLSTGTATYWGFSSSSYLAPAFVIGPSATTFNWGSESGEADEAWFARLYGFLRYNPGDSSWVGKTKSVTLSSAVLGTTTHKIVCIGVNQDGDRTVTFQTLNCLANETAFGSYTLWSDSIARAKCQEYYNAFPGKAYIKTVAKLTSIGYDRLSLKSTQETVWIPSHVEMGFAGSGNNRGEWTQGGSGAAYSYYADNAKRVKKNGDSGSANPYWDRSRDHNDSRYVCYVRYDGDEGNVVYWGTRYLAPAFCIGPTPFDWGDEDVEADATWFADLKAYLVNNPGKDEWVGKEKVVTLTSEVLGMATHKIRCIGVNQDADNTVTFQTSNTLGSCKLSSLSSDSDNYAANATNYYHANNLIYDGNASGACKLYYDAFPGKASIKQLNKGTCVTAEARRDGIAIYQNQYVWIPSEGEVGGTKNASLPYGGWTETNGECTYGKKFIYTYYSSDASRVKSYYWWLRSHAYYGANYMCFVDLSGKPTNVSCNGSEGVAPAFCIGN